jgi:hypothetical protein
MAPDSVRLSGVLGITIQIICAGSSHTAPGQQWQCGINTISIAVAYFHEIFSCNIVA